MQVVIENVSEKQVRMYDGRVTLQFSRQIFSELDLFKRSNNLKIIKLDYDCNVVANTDFGVITFKNRKTKEFITLSLNEYFYARKNYVK